jgi:protoheme IX farnesyltransferase
MLARSLSILLVATTFLLVLLGGVVHTQGASLACPDWPLCYGMVFPKMEGDILLEHGHRLLASAVGVMAVLLAIIVQRERRGAAICGWAWLGVALVIFQGVLGGVTVLWRLPPPVSIAHLGTSMLFFAWGVRMVHILQPPRPAPSAALAQARGALVIATAAVYLQILLGAAVRHTHSSLSCGTDPFGCDGGWLPHTGAQWLQTSHRLWALVAAGLVISSTLPVLRAARAAGDRALRRFALGSHILMTLQIVIGVLTISTGVNLHVVVTHLGLAALLWAAMVTMVLRTGGATGSDGFVRAPTWGR